MYNHGLAAFVLGQAHGMTGDPRISPVLDRALKLIASTQCDDGGWDYQARTQRNGHDLSLAVMQAKALRSAVDSGLEVPPEVIELAIKSVREHYRSQQRQAARRPGSPRRARPVHLRRRPRHAGHGGCRRGLPAGVRPVRRLADRQEHGGHRRGRSASMQAAATAAAKCPSTPTRCITSARPCTRSAASTGKTCYPMLRDQLVASQIRDANDPNADGQWRDTRHVGGKPGELYGTAVGCFILAMPNRYLPILQEGKIENLRAKFQKE